MKELLLLRHAKTSLDFKKFKDFDRPLNDEGKKDVQNMAEKMILENFMPEQIVSSGANRAFSTSKIIAEKIDYLEKDIKINNNIYHSSLETILEIIQNFSDEFKKIMIIGHNPTFHFLSQVLSRENISKFPTCSMFCIEFNVKHWCQVEKGRKLFMFYPGLFK